MPDRRPNRAQPETLRGRELTASLTVNDIRKSLAWYRDVLGFTVAREFERDGALRAVSLVAGSVRILLTQDDGALGANRAKGVGFSLQIITAQDVDDLAQRVRSNGGTLEQEPADAFGARAFRVRDPDGIRLVISSERKAEGDGR